MTPGRLTAAFCVVLWPLIAEVTIAGSKETSEALNFATDILPIFKAKCGQCHGKQAREANLDLRTLAAIRRGGDSGPAISKKDASESLLIEKIAAGEMPPEGEPQLTPGEQKLIRRWVTSGGATQDQAGKDAWTRRLDAGQNYWAFQPLKRTTVPGAPPLVTPLANAKPVKANDESHRDYLQAWYRAETVSVDNGERVTLWRDESGHQRHLRPTWGRVDLSIGAPPRLLQHSTINGRAAVRFDDIAGLASSGNNPVDIEGDAAWTITTVVNMRPPSQNSFTSVIVGFGEPAPGHNPGKPWASLLEIRREGAWLSHSGGFGHDARLAPQSMRKLYERPIVLTVVKTPWCHDGVDIDLHQRQQC